MRLVEVALENFRSYGARTVLSIDDLTVLVGKNDAGKSTFLDALNIVLADGKIDASDIHVRARSGEEVCIECAFDDLPPELTLDATSRTSLVEEYLVDDRGLLRLRWSYGVAGEGTRSLGRMQVRVVALHPSSPTVSELHSKKLAELKKLVTEAGVQADCDLNNNASMRKALWRRMAGLDALALQAVRIDLSKDEGKSILAQVISSLPIYALFRADRPSTDQDAEVQDPMKVAIRTALEELAPEVEAMKARVREKALTVANRTLQSLRSFDATLASSLSPEFADPKLDTAFKLALVGDDGIAVNKRGSGVRRLVLFSFFRAEADRRHADEHVRGIIYAVEEPETAQHPNFQRMVVRALCDLAAMDGCQVLLTTHSPGLAGLLPVTALRMIRPSQHGRDVLMGEDALTPIQTSLGIVPDHRVRVLICVEGPYDRAFLQAACRAYRGAGEDLVCLESDPAAAFVLLGGSTLMEWVSHRLLGGIGIPEYHLYDGDVVRYDAAVREVNDRGNQDTARRTQKRELENYLHPDAITRVLAHPAGNLGPVNFGDDDDVEAIVAAAMPDPVGNPRKKLERRPLKHWLNHDVASVMSAEEFDARDPNGEIRGWLTQLTELARATQPFSPEGARQ